MSDLQRPTSPPNSMNLSVPEDERILEEDRSAGGSDGAAHTRAASADAPILPPASAPEGIDKDNEAASSNPQQTSTSHHNGRRPRKETFFGILQSSGAPANFHPNYIDDYEKYFPPDPIYEEASSPNARVYRVYIEESAKYDTYMTDESREGLDVLLVFAGLFSAVLSTFVAQTSQSLQPDRATESTLLLREIAALQRAQMNGTSVDSIPSTPTDFVPSSIDIWVNGLWFTSLTLSLASALFAVLIKQWIRHYTSFVSGTAQERSLIRQFRFMGLEKWHVPTLIGILPVLMHISLALFFAGLILFLVPLCCSIAGIVGSLSALVFIAYVATVAWPLFHIQCPYRTPLTDIIHDTVFVVRKYVLRRLWMAYVSLKVQEHKAARSDNTLVTHAFEWLITMSSNPSVYRVIVQAVGGLVSSSSIDKFVNILDHDDEEQYKMSFQHAWNDMFADSFCRSPQGVCIIPAKVDLLERLFRSALQIQQSTFFRWTLPVDNPDVRATIQSFPAPTLLWESAATALLWHYGILTNDGNFKDTALTQKACTVVHHLMSDPGEKETRLPAIVWEDLLAAASSCPSIVPLPGLSDPVLNKMIADELTSRVSTRLGPPVMHGHTHPISFRDALGANKNFIWYLLSPFDKHKENVLDSEKVQQLLSLLNAIVSYGLSKFDHKIFLGTCKELICELQAGSVTLKDQDAICVAADALLQDRPAFQGNFGPYAVLLPALLFLHCWKPHTNSRTARNAILLALIEIDMFNTLKNIEDVGQWLWSARYFYSANNTAPVASLVTAIIRRSFKSRTGPESQLEDSRWLEYLSLPENSAAIVSIFTFQGTTDTPASVAQVRDDLLFFFSLQSLECDTLQQCRTSLESHFEDFVPPIWQDTYGPNIKEARKVIDQLIAKQSPKPANPLRHLLRRSRKSPDLEARYPQVELSSLNTANMSSS